MIKIVIKIISLAILELCIVVLQLLPVNCYAENNITKAEASTLLQQSNPLGFEENKGQMVDENNNLVPYVLFKAETPGLNIWLTTTGLTYQFFTIDKKYLTNADGTPKIGFDGNQEKEKSVRWHRVDMVLKGASIKKENVQTQGDITQGNVSYYLGHCPDGIFNVKTHAKIIVNEVYPGIDWVLYTSKTGGLKHDFVVHAGADPTQITLLYEGSGQMDIEANQLKFNNELGNITEGKLLCYQGSTSNIVQSTYQTSKNTSPNYLGAGNTLDDFSIPPTSETLFSYEISIDLANYDKSQDLIIDPELVWGTLYGGNGADGFTSMDVDSNANLFITGYVNHITFPVLDPGGGAYYQSLYAGGGPFGDAFVLRFDSVGQRTWATYYGGMGFEIPTSITTDIFGSIFITGFVTSSDFPVQSAGGLTYFQATHGGGTFDVFILKFDNIGNRLWATYYGGLGNDLGSSITGDIFGNAWLTGTTESADFPTSNPGGTTYFQNTNLGSDVFIAKFDNIGNQLWSTYYGEAGDEIGNSIATDLAGNVFIAGQTDSASFPTFDPGNGAYFQGFYGGGMWDAFILKFDNSGQRIWSTLCGGSGNDMAEFIAIDLSGNVFVMGQTDSSDFPTLDAGGETYFQDVVAGGGDIFISKFSNTGNQLWSTLYGGNGNEQERTIVLDNIAIDVCGNVYIALFTQSTDMPTFNPSSCHYYDSLFGGGVGNDAFIIQFDNTGKLLWASYIGDDQSEQRLTLTTDKYNNLFMGGEFRFYPNTVNLPMQDPGGGAYFVNTPPGGEDSYILKFSPLLPITSQSQINNTLCFPCNGSATVNYACGLPPYSFVWSNGAQSLDTMSRINTISGLCSGDYNVIMTSNCNQMDTLYFTITEPIATISTVEDTICQGDSILLGGDFQTVADTYSDTLFGANFIGCDSIINTSLIVNSLAISYQTITACDSVVINSQVYTSSQVVNDTLLGLAFNGCDSIISITITVQNCEIYISNAFSPNGDGENDFFRVTGEGISQFVLKIYNRWGRLVHESRALTDFWDGKINGQLANEGVYVYVVDVTFNDTTEELIRGNLTLIR